MVQVSCLGVEEHSEEDPRCLILTSRRTDGSVTCFIMLASSPEIKQAWLDDVVQILETQRNFLNGTRAQRFLCEGTSLRFSSLTSLLPPRSPSVSNRVPAQGRQIKQPRQKYQVSVSYSIWSATSLLCIHRTESTTLSAASQHFSALFASTAAQPGCQSGVCTATLILVCYLISFS